MEAVELSVDDFQTQCKLSDYVSPKEIATVFTNGDAVKSRKKPPSKQNSQQNGKTLTPRTNTVFCHLQRDLKSPAVNVRKRALKSIQSSAKSTNTTESDELPVEHKAIITADTRPSIQEVMKDIVVYVEVRSGVDNRSEGVSKVIEALGARVNKRLTRNTTHVVFKDGLLSTFKKARALKIPVVSILWIEACKNERRICNPADYPISNIDRYEYPELYGKMKRYKFMQPGSETNKRIRAKKQLRESPQMMAKPPVKPKDNQSDITRYLKQHDSSTQRFKTVETPTRTPGGKNVVDSPATILLNRMSSNTYTPIANLTKSKSTGKHASAVEQTQSTPLTSQRKCMENNINATTNSIAQMSICQTPQTSSNKSVIRRRRTLAPQNTILSPNAEHEKQSKDQRSVVLMTEQIVIRGGKNAQSTVSRRTTYSYKPMELTGTIESPNVVNNVDSDTCTPTERQKNDSVQKDKDQNDCIGMSTPSAISLNRRRRTLFDLSMDIISQQVQNLNSKTRLSIVPPNAPHAHNSDTNNCAKEIVMPQHECNVLSSGSEATLIEPNDDSPLVIGVNEVPNETIQTAEKKKRKLFKPVDASPFSPQGATLTISTPTMSSRKSINAYITQKSTIKRRRTVLSKQITVPLINNESDFSAITPSVTPLNVSKQTLTRRSTMDFETIQQLKSKAAEKRIQKQNMPAIEKENNSNLPNANDNVGDGKPNAKKRLPFLAFTNMHKEQVEVITEAVLKLGKFKLDRTVCAYTTHMVSLEARRTMNLLRGLVRGLWILDYKWVVDSLQAGYWLPEEAYEMKDFSRAVEICRAERQAFGNNYKCELFADLGAFFISPRCDNVPIRELKELIRLCSGKVEDQRHNAKYILSSCTKAFDDKIYVTPLWILDSITQMQLMRIQKYSALSQLPTIQSLSNTRNMPTAIEYKDPHRFISSDRSNTTHNINSKSPSRVVIDSRLSAIYTRTCTS